MFSRRSKRVSLCSPKSIPGTQRIALTQFRGNSWDMESEADSKDHLNIEPSPSLSDHFRVVSSTVV